MSELFSIHQVCQSCDLSRSTILRLEERGLLKPASIDPKTGYRRYDNHNVSLIMQVKLFLHMGMSYDDIVLYYQSNGTSPELMERMEERFLLFKRALDEVRLRLERKEYLHFDFVELPEYVCRVRKARGATLEEHYQTMYQLYHETVEEGCRLLASEPLFVIKERTDFLEGSFQAEWEENYVCCVPLEPDRAPEDAVVYPSCQALSCLAYGSYTQLPTLLNAMGREVRERGLKPAGYVRVLGLVAPYTGRDISQNNYVTRLVLPIERESCAASG